MPAPRGTNESDEDAAAKASLKATRSKEAACYGIDSEEFTDRVTELMLDFIAGGMEDVKADFQKKRRRREGNAAFDDEQIAKRTEQYIKIIQHDIETRTDTFELYLARNLFRVPESLLSALEKKKAGGAGAEKKERNDEDAMEVDGDQAGGGAAASSSSSSSSHLAPLPNQLPTHQDEEDMDGELQAMRIQIRQTRRQRKAVERLNEKGESEWEVAQKEAYELRVRFMQTLNDTGGRTLMEEALDNLGYQRSEAMELSREAIALVPKLQQWGKEASGGKEGGAAGFNTKGGAKGAANGYNGGGEGGGASYRKAIAPDMSDIHTRTKEDIKALSKGLRPGERV